MATAITLTNMPTIGRQTGTESVLSGTTYALAQHHVTLSRSFA